MSNYVIVAYAIGAGLLWGYAALMWLEFRAVAQRMQNRNVRGGEKP